MLRIRQSVSPERMSFESDGQLRKEQEQSNTLPRHLFLSQQCLTHERVAKVIASESPQIAQAELPFRETHGSSR